jgi:hypothetical protein
MPAAIEIDYLNDASRGNLGNVFLLKSLEGFVAFPRTSIVENMEGPGALMIDVKVTGYRDGWAYLGSYVETEDRHRMDILHSRRLPSNPASIQTRGHLTVEYFGDQKTGSTVLIHGKSSYVLLTGSAVLLTNGLVRASVALSGPPDVFSTGWQASSEWKDLPSWGESQLEAK